MAEDKPQAEEKAEPKAEGMPKEEGPAPAQPTPVQQRLMLLALEEQDVAKKLNVVTLQLNQATQLHQRLTNQLIGIQRAKLELQQLETQQAQAEVPDA